MPCPFRARWYRIKARDGFHCTADGCKEEFRLSVVRGDGKPFTIYDAAEDNELTTRCKAHGGTGQSTPGVEQARETVRRSTRS